MNARTDRPRVTRTTAALPHRSFPGGAERKTYVIGVTVQPPTTPRHRLRRVRARLLAAVVVLGLGAGMVAASPPPPTGSSTASPYASPSASPSAGPSPYMDGIRPVTSAAGFTHPGVFLGLPQLESVRRKIAAGVDPQASIYAWLTGPAGRSIIDREPDWSVYSDADDLSQPCDPTSAQGCVMDAGYKRAPQDREHTDLAKQNMSVQINSAYTNALLYYYSGGDETYAENAVRMLNAYGHSFRGFTATRANGYAGELFAAWMAETLVRAAEIIRYTYQPGAGQTAFDVDAFESMLRTAFVPRLQNGTTRINNWRTSATEGLMNIGVFLDDRDLYEKGLALWREVTPTYIYLASDGARPASLLKGSDAQRDCSWVHDFSDHCTTNPKTLPGLVYQNGQNEETCRDMWHSAAGVGGIINAAETAALQGDDLYGEQRARIMTGLSYMLQLSQGMSTYGYPDDFCAGAGKHRTDEPSGDSFPTTWDATNPLSVVVAYNHYVTQEGRSFATVRIPGWSDSYPNTDPVTAYIALNRSGPTDVRGYVTAWQVLTHTGVGAGVAPDSAPQTLPTPTPTPTGLSPADTGPALALPLLAAVLAVLAAVVGLLTRRRVRRRRRRNASRAAPSE